MPLLDLWGNGYGRDYVNRMAQEEVVKRIAQERAIRAYVKEGFTYFIKEKVFTLESIITALKIVEALSDERQNYNAIRDNTAQHNTMQEDALKGWMDNHRLASEVLDPRAMEEEIREKSWRRKQRERNDVTLVAFKDLEEEKQAKIERVLRIILEARDIILEPSISSFIQQKLKRQLKPDFFTIYDCYFTSVQVGLGYKEGSCIGIELNLKNPGLVRVQTYDNDYFQFGLAAGVEWDVHEVYIHKGKLQDESMLRGKITGMCAECLTASRSPDPRRRSALNPPDSEETDVAGFSIALVNFDVGKVSLESEVIELELTPSFRSRIFSDQE